MRLVFFFFLSFFLSCTTALVLQLPLFPTFFFNQFERSFKYQFIVHHLVSVSVAALGGMMPHCVNKLRFGRRRIQSSV